MKKRILYIIALFFAFAAQPVASQNVLFNAYFDSVHIDTKEMRIGEQVKLTLELSVDPGYNVDIQVPDDGCQRQGNIQERVYHYILP